MSKQAQTQLHAKRLREALAQIPDLRSLPDKVWSPTFEGWQERVTQSLATVFGSDQDYTRRFKRLRFLSPQFHPSRTWNSDDEQEFTADLALAEELLKEALEELDVAPPAQDATPAASVRSPVPVVINVTNLLSQATNVTVSQILASSQFSSLPAEVQEKAALHAKELDEEIRGQQRWPVLAKSLEALKSLGKGAYEHVALPLLLDMLKKQAGL